MGYSPLGFHHYFTPRINLGQIILLLCSVVYSLAAHGDTQPQEYGTGCS